MPKIIIIFLLLSSLACQKAEPAKVETKPESTPNPTVQTKTEPTQNLSDIIANVPKLANKTPVELDKILGKPLENKEKGAYRLYKLANEPKGLAVRFLGGKAVSFNLIMSKPFATSQEALLKGFGIDVGKVPPTKNAKEPLSEKYQGMFNGVKFNKVSAKKDENTNQYIFILAEVAE